MQVQTKEPLKMEFYRHDKFGDVPLGWDVVRLGDYFNFFPTASYSRSLLTDMGECQYIHYGDLHTKFERFIDASKDELPFITIDMAKRYTSIQEGDLIISDASEDYEGVGKAVEVINVGDKTIISGLHTLHLRSKNNEFINGFKGYVLNESRVRNSILKSATGIKVYSVSKTELKKIYLPKPPVEEQKAIATILSKVDEAIKATENSIKAAEKLKKSLMQNLLTGKLKPYGTWRKEDEFYMDEKFGNVPVGWEVKRVEQLVNRRTDNFDPLKSSESLDYVGLEHILPNEFRREGVGKSDETLALKIKFFIGDVLLGKLRPYLNKVWIADLNGVGSTEFLVFEGNKYSKWVYLNFQSKRFLDFTQSVTAGTQHPRASYRDVKRFLLSVPKDDNEMDLITNAIISTEKLKDDKLVRIKMLQRLKKSLMQNLLTGKVRVDLSKIENVITDEAV